MNLAAPKKPMEIQDKHQILHQRDLSANETSFGAATADDCISERKVTNHFNWVFPACPLTRTRFIRPDIYAMFSIAVICIH